MTLRVVVAYAAPGAEAIVAVDLPEGATVADAIRRAGVVARLGLDADTLTPAIFGQRAEPATPLADGDRVELTRPLVADAKALRRARVKPRRR
ncbi:MAG TPA: RnfH family protein [Casimicrobiaceae bacterium]|nr:RnfH family protein [Casimicrobiaceae bacterium]